MRGIAIGLAVLVAMVALYAAVFGRAGWSL